MEGGGTSICTTEGRSYPVNLSKSEDAAVTSIKRSDHYSHHQKKLFTSQNTTGVDRKKTTGGITGRKRLSPSSHTVSYGIPIDHCFKSVAMKIK